MAQAPNDVNPVEIQINALVPDEVPVDPPGAVAQPAPIADQNNGDVQLQVLLDRIKALEEKQKPSVSSLKKYIVQYAFRQAPDFDKYKALEMVENLKNVAFQLKDKRADFYFSVHTTLLERIKKPTEQFKNYVLSLLGDRDYEKVLEAINKVDKSFAPETSAPPNPPDQAHAPVFQGFPYPSPPGNNRFPGPSTQHRLAATYAPHPYFSPRSARGYRNARFSGGGGRQGAQLCHFCGMANHYVRNCWQKREYDEQLKRNAQNK